MLYYENGYETVNRSRLCELRENGCCEAAVPLKFLGFRSRLVMLGVREELLRAFSYLDSQLKNCSGSSAEFELHFMCEQLFDVRIVKTDCELMSA